MRKIFVATMLTSLIATAGFAQEKETLKGSGKIVTREVSVSSFSSLKASGVYELKLSQRSKEAVSIEADDNLQEYFSVANEGDKLVISMKNLKDKNLKSGKMKVYVTFKKLTQMALAMVGNVRSEDELSFDDISVANNSVGNVDLKLNASKLKLTNSSVGNVRLDGKASDAIVKNNGVGNLKAGNFVVQTMSIENTGVGNAEVNAEKDLKITDSFLGKVNNKGKAEVKRNNRVRV